MQCMLSLNLCMPPVPLTSTLSTAFFVICRVNLDWAGCRDSCRSITGYAIFLRPNLIAWCSKKQPTVSKSSTEPKYLTIGYTVAEAIWIHKLLCDLSMHLSTLVHVYCDNLSATCMSANRVQHDHSKHITVTITLFMKELLMEI